MPNEVDARGLSCPQPVLLTLQTIQSSDGKEDICVLVDNQASFENVSRAATAKGWTVAGVSEQRGISYHPSQGIMAVMGWFGKSIREEPPRSSSKEISGKGILVFHHTSDVIQAESLLKQAGMAIRVMGPPPNLRTGCDLVIEFPLILELEVRRILSDSRIQPIQTVPVHDTLLSPVSLFQTRDYGDYLMVRAANMKLTIHKSSRRIVNISGGGCPDVPWLADQLIGKTIDDAQTPQRLGKTLCGYALHLAWEEMHRQCPG